MKPAVINLTFVVRSYFFVIILLLSMSAVMALLLSLITTLNTQAESPLAYENLIFTVERGSHGFLDLLELLIGGVIGSLAATLQFSMHRPVEGKNIPETAETATPAAPESPVNSPVADEHLNVNPRTVVLTYLGVITILCLGVLMFIFFTIFTALNISMEQFSSGQENITLAVLTTFDQMVGGMVGLVEVAVGGVIGALGATLNYVMANRGDAP